MRIVAGYAVFSALWIGFSDRLLAALVTDRELLATLSMLKGWAFVAVTSALLYGLLRRSFTELAKEMEARVRADRAMHRTEDSLQALSDNLPRSYVYTYMVTPEGPRFLYVSAGVERLHGLKPAQVVADARTLLAQVDERDIPRLTAREIASQTELADFHVELRIHRPDGEIRWLEIQSRAKREDDGHVVWHGVVNDVTERKITSDALHSSEERLRRLVSFLPDGLFINQNNRIVFANERALQLWRAKSADEVLNRSPFDFFHPDEHPHMAARVTHLRTAGGVVPLWETRAVALDGTVIPVETTGRVVPYGNEDAIMVVVRDITDRIRAEQSLRESEERFRQVADNVDEVFWLTDAAKEKMLYVSPAYERIWGVSREVLYRNTMQWVDAIVPEDRERIEQAMHKQGTATYNEEYRILRPDGATRWISDRAFPVRGSDGEVYRIVGIARDITETKRLEEQFLRAQRMEAIGTLASGVAHDLNNILAPIMMMSGLLRTKLPDRGDQELLSMAEKAASRGASIVSQLLTFSRGAAGERSELRLEILIGEMIHLIQETFPRNIHPRRQIAAGVPAISASPTQMHQVLLNLCVNARDAMPAGGDLTLALRPATVDAAAASRHNGVASGEFLVLSVEDTGAGIPAELQHRIFDPFFTTKEVGKGTGLGLSTVLGIVRSHGGFVELDSEVGRGTRFDVYLPVCTGTPALSEQIAVQQPPRGRGERVLLVDDEQSLLIATAAVLREAGYAVTTADSAEAALRCFADAGGNFDLLLSDVVMPGVDGWSLAAQLRERKSGLRVVLSSGLDETQKSAQLGKTADFFLPKPMASAELLETVRRALD